MNSILADTIRVRFFAPVLLALSQSCNRRHCPEFTDEQFIESGIGRVIGFAQSGRDWVQRMQMWMNSRLSVSNFFQSLKSTRRLQLLNEVSENVRQQVDATLPETLDPLAPYPELKGFAIYASDGHYEQPGSHTSEENEKGEAVGYFFSLNLRSHSLTLLDIARPIRKRENDITALKRLGSTQLLMNESKGVKVIHVYDPAVIDYAQWRRWKAKGVYIISREKANSMAEVVGNIQWDQCDPRNLGVLADDLVGVFCGVMLRRVTYCDPATGTVYTYMTSEMTLPPGLIAFLYKLRWDVEKVFDEKKNKLNQKKAWACSRVAHAQQAYFVCLAHNLMVLLERHLETQEGITDVKVQDKRKHRAAQLEAQLKQQGLVPNPLVQQCTRMTQRSLQFIRWLRHCLQSATSYNDGLTLLRPLMQDYIS